MIISVSCFTVVTVIIIIITRLVTGARAVRGGAFQVFIIVAKQTSQGKKTFGVEDLGGVKVSSRFGGRYRILSDGGVISRGGTSVGGKHQ